MAGCTLIVHPGRHACLELVSQWRGFNVLARLKECHRDSLAHEQQKQKASIMGKLLIFCYSD